MTTVDTLAATRADLLRMRRWPTLWVLADNHRARGLYEHLEWQPTGRSRQDEWPPYPPELELTLPESRHAR